MTAEDLLALRRDLDQNRIDLYNAFDALLNVVDRLYDGNPCSNFGTVLKDHFKSELTALQVANRNPKCKSNEDLILEAMGIYLKDKDKTKKSPTEGKSLSSALPPVILLASA
jgi:hypothetical protein